MEKLRPRAPFITRIITGIVFFLLFFPLLIMVFRSFYDPDVNIFTLKWYNLLIEDQELLNSLSLSFKIALLTGVLATLLGTFSALVLYKSKMKGAVFLKLLLDQALIIPEIVFALSLLGWFALLQFSLGFYSILAAHITFTLSFVVLTLLARLKSLDRTLEFAAEDLGASSFAIFFHILLPQLKPALLSAFLLSFLLSFDDFLITFFIGGANGDTLPIKLYARAKMGYSPKVNAISTLLLLLSSILSFILIKQIQKKKKEIP